MKLLDIITTASSNMFRSKLRTSLTVIAIFIGAFTLTLTNGLGAGISKYIDTQIGNLGAKDILVIMGTGGGDETGVSTDAPKKYDPNKRTQTIASQGSRTITLLTQQDIDKIRKTPGIKSVEAFAAASIDYVSVGTSDKFTGSVAQYIDGTNIALDAGRLPREGTTAREIMIPASYLESLKFKDAGDAVGKTLRIGLTNGLGRQSEVSATIIGVQQKSLVNGSAMNTSAPLMQELLRVQNTGLPATATSNVEAAVARFDSSYSATQITELKERLKKAGYSAQTFEDQIGTFKAVIAGIVAVLNGFAVIALLAASFGIINTLLMSVQERTREIGLMKAMGMGGGRIFLLFSFEAVMLGFWGSLIGSAVAILVGSVINKVVLDTFLKDLVGLQLLSFTPVSVAVIVGIVMLIAFLAGSLPAVRAARQNPIDSLRYE